MSKSDCAVIGGLIGALLSLTVFMIIYEEDKRILEYTFSNPSDFTVIGYKRDGTQYFKKDGKRLRLLRFGVSSSVAKDLLWKTE